MMEAQRPRERPEQEQAMRDFDDREQRARRGRERDIGARIPDRRRVSPSPDRRCGRCGRPGSPPTVHTVIKDSGIGRGWPILTKTNYAEWSMVMKVKMCKE
ncbi:hypothetical protein PVAP13_8KG230906 [Panicum virgatum]|uniref:DUF4219 domain-containing protein n=1 Tax=Panicum virgatum TaxID=38727 RepID=A0A8T0PLR6_PANVG|nr:hypothetical protein PVAP13_8KG230906 [Panicum virgatum]